MDHFFETEHLALPREIARRGWIGVTIPRRYGGMDVGHLAKTLIVEALARVSGAAAQAAQLGVAKILNFGTERQQARRLPTIAVTEPESGGHVLGMGSTAVRDGDAYVLDGRKCFVGNSHIERYLRDVVHTFPAAGTSDVQRLRLAEVALGRYRREWSGRVRELVAA